MREELFQRLEQLYTDMEQAYARTAQQAGLNCTGCPDNCCTSYFQHHTHMEWAYLWDGLRTLPQERLEEIRAKALEHVRLSRQMLKQQRAPNLMCPLNADGRCMLYAHRLMICRLHGVPNRFTLPNGQARTFPGCFRCQEILAGQDAPPVLERTDFYRRLAALEMDFLRDLTARSAKVRLTLAQMIHQGSPKLEK